MGFVSAFVRADAVTGRAEPDRAGYGVFVAPPLVPPPEVLPV